MKIKDFKEMLKANKVCLIKRIIYTHKLKKENYVYITIKGWQYLCIGCY